MKPNTLEVYKPLLNWYYDNVTVMPFNNWAKNWSSKKFSTISRDEEDILVGFIIGMTMVEIADERGIHHAQVYSTIRAMVYMAKKFLENQKGGDY